MKSKPVNPAVAILILALTVAGIWFVYTRVFTGQQAGFNGPPANAFGKKQ